MSNISTFNFQSNSVRVVFDEKNTPLFVAKDVANALGYTDTINAIKQHCKGVAKHHPIKDSLNRSQNVRVIYEPDVYRLIFGSKLESAIKFQDWVFEEVLPTIRKTGIYTAPTHSTVADRRELVRAVQELVGATGAMYSTIWRMIHRQFGVSDVGELTVAQVNEAIAYVDCLYLYGLHNAQTQDNGISEGIMINGKHLIHHAYYIFSWYKAIEEPFRALSPHLSGQIHDHMSGMKWFASALAEQLQTQVPHVPQDKWKLGFDCMR